MFSKLSHDYNHFYIWIILYESRNQNQVLWWKYEENRVYSGQLIIIFIYPYACCYKEFRNIWFIPYDSCNEELCLRKHLYTLIFTKILVYSRLFMILYSLSKSSLSYELKDVWIITYESCYPELFNKFQKNRTRHNSRIMASFGPNSSGTLSFVLLYLGNNLVFQYLVAVEK